ncbi:LexA family transcriptional regulator [uncultured Anaerococcus sp.]|uniref:LexA family protein n=1 Tax=uncultured Anaerococcus sp. TaxID=293428 RepID=UPI0026181AAB|nr:LexA family transcriptional regulator [uncultured Anaerococcus sp.]
MVDIKDKIRDLRKEHNYTQEEVAYKIGLSTSAYGYYEQGRTTPPLDKLKQLAHLYNISISELTGEPIDKIEMIGKATSMKRYPFVEYPISAGSPRNIEGIKNLQHLDVPDYILGKYSESKDIYFMRVNGESMNKIIPDDSLIGVQRNIDLQSLKQGDIVIYRTSAYEYSVKRFYTNDEYIIFKPFSTNPAYKDKIFSKDDEVEILGKVILYSVIL